MLFAVEQGSLMKLKSILTDVTCLIADHLQPFGLAIFPNGDGLVQHDYAILMCN